MSLIAASDKLWRKSGDLVRNRNKSISDYGFTHQQYRDLKMLCRTGEKNIREIVKKVAADVYPEIQRQLFTSICDGTSYSKLADIYISEPDFYAYRRKCYARIRERLRCSDNEI